MRLIAIIWLAVFCVQNTASANTFYMDALHGSAYGNGSYNSPIQTFWQAARIARPCDTVYVRASGTYYNQSMLYMHGTSSCPIQFIGLKSSSGGMPQMRSSESGRPPFFMAGSSYISMTGFQFTGNADNSDCFQASSPSSSDITSHITLSSNIFSNCGVDGIDFFQSDYITISHNQVYNTSRYTRGGSFGSGISILGSWNSDGSTGTKIIIDGNTIWDVTNTCPNSGCYTYSEDSDGSGIILDANCITYKYNNGAAAYRTAPCYAGRTSITNNIVMGNGGRGIHIYRSSHVTIANNTSYGNNTDPYEGNYQPGEFEVNQSGDVQLYNNLSVSLGGISDGGRYTGSPRDCISVQNHSGTYPGYTYGAGAGPIRASNNWCYRTSYNSAGVNYVSSNSSDVSISDAGYGNPNLEYLSTNNSGNFRPKYGSPILGRTNLSLYYLTHDVANNSRLSGSALGAYTNPSD